MYNIFTGSFLKKHYDLFIIDTFKSENDIVLCYSVRRLLTGFEVAALNA